MTTTGLRTLGLVATVLLLLASLAAASPAPRLASGAERRRRFDPPADAAVDEVELPELSAAHERLRRGSDLAAPLRVRFRALRRDFDLQLVVAEGLFAPRFTAVAVGADGRETPIAVDPRAFYRGGVAGEADSAVHAHVVDGQLTALVRLGRTHVQVEPVDTHGRASPRHAAHRVYVTEVPPAPADAGHDHTYCGTTGEHTVHVHDFGDHGAGSTFGSAHASTTFTAARERRVGAGGVATRNTCEMALIADHRFYASDVGGCCVGVGVFSL